ncbi:MAG TPA: metallophosphoesterase [Tepidisphaeraceae bacterium]|nr:metallophosphoesterase [Tepidisphaeraceae bacterium]
MGFILTVITMMLVLDGLWLWQSDRLLRGVRGARGWRIVSAAFVLAQVLILGWIVLARLMNLDPAASSSKALVGAVLIWHLIVLPAVLVLIIIPAISLAIADAWRRRTARTESPGELIKTPADTSPAMSRRSLLRTAAVMTPPLITTLATGVSLPQLERFRVRRLTLHLQALPSALDGMTIAHVSDVHVGRFTRGRILDQIVAATNDLDADLVLLTGDLINDSLGYLDEALAFVKRLDPRLGLAMCEGNHDLIESREGFERRTRASGVPLLINEDLIVRVRNEPIQLLGLRWGRAEPGGSRRDNQSDSAIASSMDVTLRHLRADAFPILLAHHPHAFDPAAHAGIPLTLAGHTHGGQLMLTDRIGFGPQMFRYWSGAYRKGDASLVVSNGVGNWFPLRINAPAEIVHLTLRRG